MARRLGWLYVIVLLAACGDDDSAPDDLSSERDGSAPQRVLPPADAGDREAPVSAACNEDADCDRVVGRETCDRLRGICVECLIDAECGDGMRCIQRQCQEEQSCENSLDCSLAAVCDDDTGMCVECVAGSDCDPGSLCADAHCEPRCDSDKDCTPIGMLCDAEAGHCAAADMNTGPDPNTEMPSPDAGVACTETRVQATRVLASIMFLVDGSTSMEMPYGVSPGTDAGASSATRWSVIRDALVGAGTGVVNALRAKARFGLAVFGTNATCPLPLPVIAPALDDADALAAALPLTPPGMFTPTGPALDQISDMLPDGDAAGAGPQIIVLATDGEPNDCTVDIFNGVVTNYAPSIAAAMKARGKHQELFVVSVADGSGEYAAHLQQMANIGAGLDAAASPGAHVYYPGDSVSLTETLMTLISDELPCDLELERGIAAGAECSASVTLNGNQLRCQADDGWELVDPTHIRLKGLACAGLQGDAVFTVDVPCEDQL